MIFRVNSSVSPKPRKLNGTMLSASRSARLWIPALRFSELSISSIIFCILVSELTARTLTTTEPSSTTVPANTVSSLDFITASGSPVMEASLMYASPSVISPSTGITLPVLTRILSPIFRSSIDISTSSEPFASHTLSALTARLEVSTAFVRACV